MKWSSLSAVKFLCNFGVLLLVCLHPLQLKVSHLNFQIPFLCFQDLSLHFQLLFQVYFRYVRHFAPRHFQVLLGLHILQVPHLIAARLQEVKRVFPLVPHHDGHLRSDEGRQCAGASR